MEFIRMKRHFYGEVVIAVLKVLCNIAKEIVEVIRNFSQQVFKRKILQNQGGKKGMDNTAYAESTENQDEFFIDSKILATSPAVSEASHKEKIASDNSLPKTEEGAENIVWMDINSIQTNPNQPRKVFDEECIGKIAESIKEISMINPLTVTKQNELIVLVAGEMRLRAAKLAGWTKVPCRIWNKDPIKAALAENFLRNSLTAVEEAEAFKEAEANGLTHEDIGKAVGKCRNTVTEISLIADLPDYIKDECRKNRRCSKSGLIELSKIKDEKKLRRAYKIFSDSGFNRDSVRNARKSKLQVVEVRAGDIKDDNEADIAETATDIVKQPEMEVAEVYVETKDSDVETVEPVGTSGNPVRSFFRLLTHMIQTDGISKIKESYGNELKDLRNQINEILET